MRSFIIGPFSHVQGQVYASPTCNRKSEAQIRAEVEREMVLKAQQKAKRAEQRRIKEMCDQMAKDAREHEKYMQHLAWKDRQGGLFGLRFDW